MAIDPSAVWDFAKEVVGVVRPDRGRTLATVTRIGADGTVWVTTGDGGEAPAGSAAAGVSVGDTVSLEWDGSAMGIRSNVSNPSLPGSVVRRAVARAQGVADAAQKVADAVNQHFFADGHGIHVTEATQEEWDESHTGANVLINSVGQLFRDGLLNLLTLTTQGGARALTVWDGLGNAASNIRAIIGETITLGPIGSVRMILSASDMALVNESSDEIFSIDSGSTGTSTVALTASLVTWSTTASVDTTTRTVSDTGTASGTTTVTAAINGTGYTLDSTYATATVTAGTGVSVALTSAGVTYVQSLMVETVEVEEGTVTTTYPCELSVTYQHAVTDKATMSLMGNQTVYGDGSGIISVINDKWSSSHQSNTSVSARNATTGKAVQLLVGSGGHNRGLFDTTENGWIIYRDANGKTVVNGPNFSVNASGYVKSNGETVNGNLLVSNGWSKVLRSNWSSSSQKPVFHWTENSVTGQRVAFGIGNNGYERGIWDSGKSRWIVVKSQSDVVTYYGLHSNLAVTSHNIVNNVSVEAGDQQVSTASISASGWYPIGIVGWSANTRYVVITRCRIDSSSNGSGTIGYAVYNNGSIARSITVTAYVLWARGD